MKHILLHSPAVRNDRSYVDAGETVAVGDDGKEIGADRARELVDAQKAVATRAPAAA